MLQRAGFLGAFLGAIALFAPATVQAARPLGPPIEELTSRYNIVMVAQAAERVDGGRVRFERVLPYFNDPAASVVLRTGEGDHPFIEVGKTYLVGYTLAASDPQFRDAKYLDPEGPKIVEVRGSDARAVFTDTPELRFLFEQILDDQPDPTREMLDALLTQMQRDDERARSLVVLELMLRPDLIAAVDADQGQVIRALITSEAVPTQIRDLLLATASRLEASAQAGWLAEVQRDIVRSAPLELDLASPMPSFVRTAVRGLKSTGEAGDLPALRRLLGSNAPGVAKAALDTMDGLDPVATLAIARETRADASILAETRRVLGLYVERMELRNGPQGS